MEWIYWCLMLLCLTRVNPNANREALIRHVVDSEDLDASQEMQCHGRYLQSMKVTIADGQTTGHHVRITNCFHLVMTQR